MFTDYLEFSSRSRFILFCTSRVSWFSLAGCQVPAKAAPSLPLLSWRGEKKIRRIARGLRLGQGEITQQLPLWAKQTRLGENSLTYQQSNQSRIMRNISSTVDLDGLQGHILPYHGLLHRLQGNLCSSTWSTSSPSFFTYLGIMYLLHSLSLTPLLLQLFPLLNYVTQRCYHHH